MTKITLAKKRLECSLPWIFTNRLTFKGDVETAPSLQILSSFKE